MEWLAMVMGVGVTAGLMVYLTQPWWGRQGEGKPVLAGAASRPGQTPVERREAVLTALRDLDFDYEVGKITEEDYSLLRPSLLAEAAAVISQPPIRETATEADLDDRIEAQILAVRRNLHSTTASSVQPGLACVNCGRPARSDALYCTGCGTRLHSTCPECGMPIRTADHFCAGCGMELALALSG